MPPPKVDDEAIQHDDKLRTPSSGSSPSAGEHAEKVDGQRKASVAPSAAALLRNPLAGMSEEDVIADVDDFIETRGLSEHREVFRKGALLARVNGREEGFEDVTQISEDEKNMLRHEVR